MGQKINPHGLRVGVIKDWDSRWYARNEKVGDLVVEDYNLRKYLKKTPLKIRKEARAQREAMLAEQQQA